MKLMYLKYKQIDLVKWDRCINNAFNGNIYGYSWYLNIACQNWDALVYDNYTAVFPLPVFKKMGIQSIYHPLLSGQLGIFSIDKLDRRLVNLFLERIPNKFRNITIRLNKYITIDECDFQVKSQTLHVIDLIRNSNNIYNGYSPALRKIIDKSLLGNMSVINAVRPNEVIHFLSGEGTIINKPLKPEHYHSLRQLMACILNSQVGNIYATYSNENNISAIGIFLFSHNKLSIPLIATNPEGIQNHAVELLIHSIIFNNMEKNVTLAYEESGNTYFSDIFVSFGAEQKQFKELFKRHLMWPINKILKHDPHTRR
jgi:hypothetical protein